MLPVTAQGQVEGGHRPAERGDGKTDGEDDALEVHARGACEVDADRQHPVLGVRGRVPLHGTVLAAGERPLDLAGKRGLADPTHTVEGEDVTAWSFQVLHVEVRTGYVLYVLREADRHRLPLRLPVCERLAGGEAPVVRAEQRSKIPPRDRLPQMIN